MSSINRTRAKIKSSAIPVPKDIALKPKKTAKTVPVAEAPAISLVKLPTKRLTKTVPMERLTKRHR